MTSYVFNVAKDLLLDGGMSLEDPTHGSTSGAGQYAAGLFRVMLLQDGNQLADPASGTFPGGGPDDARELQSLATAQVTAAQLKECTSTGYTDMAVDAGAYADATLANMAVTQPGSGGTIKWDADDIQYENIGDTGTQQTLDDLLIVWAQQVPTASGGEISNGASIIPICLITLTSPIVTNNGDLDIVWNTTGIITLA